jgi:hypothetical protein
MCARARMYSAYTYTYVYSWKCNKQQLSGTSSSIPYSQTCTTYACMLNLSSNMHPICPALCRNHDSILSYVHLHSITMQKYSHSLSVTHEITCSPEHFLINKQIYIIMSLTHPFFHYHTLSPDVKYTSRHDSSLNWSSVVSCDMTVMVTVTDHILNTTLSSLASIS